MRNETRRSKLFTRRALALISGKLAVMFTLASRLYYLQVIKSGEFKTLSDSNRIKLFLLPPLRGKIIDRFNRVVSSNQIDYRILFAPYAVGNAEGTFLKLASILEMSDQRKEQGLRRIRTYRGQQPILLQEHLSWEEVGRVEVNSPDLPGITIEAGQVRYYPLRNVTAHLVGYVGAVSEQELTKHPMLRHPDFKIGKSGIEKAFEYQLRGEAGVKKMEVNAYGLSVRQLSYEESKSGAVLPITIDAQLQEYVDQRLLEAKSASAVVLDVEKGDVLAMSSVPNFDPNKFVGGIPLQYWKELINDPLLPLLDKTVAQLYPPGSTFKTMTALAALMQGVDPNKTAFCPGYLQLGNLRFRCWKEGGHGHLNMRQAIMHSCNVFFFQTGRAIGIDSIAAMAKQFGLGSETGIEIPGEKAGIMPSREWKRARLGVSWQQGDTLNTSIGQGFVLTTPLQLAVMVARLASKGKMIKPHVKLYSKAEMPAWKQMNIPASYFDIVLGGMHDVVNVPGGTAFGSRIPYPQYEMGGKTGTSQVVSRKSVERNRNLINEWKNQNHALFIGFAPVDKPKYATAVVVEHGLAGSKAAAPVGRDILLKAQQLQSAEKINIQEVNKTDTNNGNAS